MREGSVPQRARWLLRVFYAASSGPVLSERGALDRVSHIIAERVPHDGIAVFVLDPNGDAVHLVARTERLLAGDASVQSGWIHPAAPQAWGRAALERRAIVEDRATAAQLPLPGAIGSYLVVPISLRGELSQAWVMYLWQAEGAAGRASLPLARRAAQALRGAVPAGYCSARAQRLGGMVERLPSGLLGLDRYGRVVEGNHTGFALLGVPNTRPLGRTLDSLLAPASRQVLADGLEALARGDGLVNVQITSGHGDAPLDASLAPVVNDSVLAVQVRLDDAQPRLAGEAELRRRADALAFLRELAEAVATESDAGRALSLATTLVTLRLGMSGAAIASVTPGGSVRLLAARGIDPEAATALFRERVVRPARDGIEQVPTNLAASLLGTPLSQGALVLLAPLLHAERLVGLALFIAPEEGPALRVELLLASARTIAVALHASLEYAEALRLAAERRQLLDAIPSIVFRIDPDTGATLYANAAVERVLGTPTERALGLPGLEGLLADANERDAFVALRRSANAGEEQGWTDRRFSHRDGRSRILRVRLYRFVPPAAGGPARAVIEGIAQDVTDEIDARKRLVQSDRLASLGMLAAGVAHEINNPTAFISLGVQQLARLVAQLDGGEPLSAPTRRRIGEVLAELADGVQRIVQIVGELKLFTRIPESAFSTPVDVNRLIISAVTLARAELRNRAKLEVELGELPLLPGDHARLGQVFVNLLVNAAQAVPPGAEDHNVVRVVTRALDEAVLVEVSDTGVGIPPEHLPRIFDPFFTTKPPGEGTGLGLAISHDLVRRAGGSIDVQSEPGFGTRFVVRLPVRDFASPDAADVDHAVPETGGRVLIVEDEQHLAVAIARALATQYLVELAPDAEVALERIERSALTFDAVLCDLRMPGMDGRAFYEAVRERWPQQAARFVFLTGAGLIGEFEPFVRTTSQPVLEKPFEMAELEELVAQVVARGRASRDAP